MEYRAGLHLAVAAIALAGAMANAQTTAPDIGIAEWVNPSAIGRAPSVGSTRDIASGALMIERERVSTNSSGVVDFIFYNESRLLVGPGCEVVLDHLYYDSRLDVEVKEFSFDTAFRCIARVDNTLAANPRDVMVIKTPRGNIVVSNASVYLVMDDDKVAVASSDMGTGGYASADDGTEREVIRRPGNSVVIDDDGIRGPGRTNPDFIDRVKDEIEGVDPSRPGWNGPYVLYGPEHPDLRPPVNCHLDECEFRPGRRTGGGGGGGRPPPPPPPAP